MKQAHVVSSRKSKDEMARGSGTRRRGGGRGTRAGGKAAGLGRPSRVDLSISAPVGRAHGTYLRTNLPRVLALLDPALRELSVALVGLRTMADLHERFMGIDGPTDVLTFELEHDGEGRVVAGEVVVCVPYALAQARERQIPPRHEVLLYALHGILHLCGFDDRTERAFAAMHRREDEILTQLGIGRVFHRDAPAAKAARGSKKLVERTGTRRTTGPRGRSRRTSA